MNAGSEVKVNALRSARAVSQHSLLDLLYGGLLDALGQDILQYLRTESEAELDQEGLALLLSPAERHTQRDRGRIINGTLQIPLQNNIEFNVGYNV